MRQMGNGGTMLSIDVKGGKEAAFRVLNALKIAVISNNLGDAKTIATPPLRQRISVYRRSKTDAWDYAGFDPSQPWDRRQPEI